MNQADLIKEIGARAHLTQAWVSDLLRELAAVTQEQLQAGGEVTLPGIGKLKVQDKPAKVGRNPKTGAEVQIPAKRVPKFSAAKALKDALQ